jgi:hypothetical protein
MTLDDYMNWWMRGANGAFAGRDRPPLALDGDRRTAYDNGRLAYEAAEKNWTRKLQPWTCVDCGYVGPGPLHKCSAAGE